MMRRLIFVSATVMTGILSLAGQSQAAPTNVGEVIFKGDVPTQCVFYKPRDGQIGLAKNGAQTLGSTDAYTRGSSGYIGLKCNGEATLFVAAPVQLEGQTKTDVNVATVRTDVGETDSQSGKGLQLKPDFSQDSIVVDVENTDTQGTIMNGGYAYRVLVTAASN